MRSLIAMAAALVLLAGIKIQDARPFTMKSGSVMTYEDSRFDAQGNQTKTDATYTVTKVETNDVPGGQTKFFVEAKSGETTTKLVFSYSGEYFVWGTVGTEGGLQIFKLGAKKGDTWKPNADAPEEVKVTYEDDEEVTTTAGKFMCKRLVITAGDNGIIRVSFWFADKVGLVKASKEMFGTNQASIELKKFVEGK